MFPGWLWHIFDHLKRKTFSNNNSCFLEYLNIRTTQSRLQLTRLPFRRPAKISNQNHSYPIIPRRPPNLIAVPTHLDIHGRDQGMHRFVFPRRGGENGLKGQKLLTLVVCPIENNCFSPSNKGRFLVLTRIDLEFDLRWPRPISIFTRKVSPDLSFVGHFSEHMIKLWNEWWNDFHFILYSQFRTPYTFCEGNPIRKWPLLRWPHLKSLWFTW